MSKPIRVMSHWHQSITATIDTYRAEYFLLGIVCLSEAQAAGVLLINLALAAFGFCWAPSAHGCFRTVKLGLGNRGMLAPDSGKITASQTTREAPCNLTWLSITVCKGPLNPLSVAGIKQQHQGLVASLFLNKYSFKTLKNRCPGFRSK